jgi:tetratricopeptide (TPR) repeat protein
VGRYDEALQVLERTVPIYRAGNDLEAEARVTALIGRVHFSQSRCEEGIARVQPLIDQLEARGPLPGLGDLYVALVPLFAPTGRYQEYLATAERASDLGRSLGDEWILAQGEMWRGVALAHLRRVEEARQALEGAVPLTESVGDLDSLGVALAFIGLTYILEGRLERARTYREQAVDAFQRSGDPGSVAWATTRLGDVFFLLGSWDQARACHERAIEMFRRLGGMPRHSAVPLVSLGELALVQGNSDEASRLLDEGLEVAVGTQHLGALRAAQYTLAEKALLEGDPEQALARLQPHPLLQRPGLEDSICTMVLPILAWAQLEVGHVDGAVATVDRGIEEATAQGNRIELPQWLRVQGLVLARQDRWELAHAAFEEAATRARSMSYVYAEARARYESGRMRAEIRFGLGLQPPERSRERLRQEAREELETARAMFQRLGARPYTERTEQALAELGGKSR